MEEYGGNMPAEWRAKGISDILRSNWENYKNGLMPMGILIG